MLEKFLDKKCFLHLSSRLLCALSTAQVISVPRAVQHNSIVFLSAVLGIVIYYCIHITVGV